MGPCLDKKKSKGKVAEKEGASFNVKWPHVKNWERGDLKKSARFLVKTKLQHILNYRGRLSRKVRTFED